MTRCKQRLMEGFGPLVRRRGSALVVTLLVIAALTGLTLGFSGESDVELSLAEFSRDGYRAYETARSAVYFAIALLDHQGREGMEELEELKREWSRFGEHPVPLPLPEGVALKGGIIDENGKLNVNGLVDPNGELDQGRVQEMERLFAAIGLGGSEMAALLDWLDSDNIERMEGAESHYYRELPEPYDCGNGPFETPGRIFLVKGLEERARQVPGEGRGLLDYITIHSDGRININSAPREVMESLSDGLDSMVSEAIMEYREEQEFESVEDLRRVMGVGDALFQEIKGRLTVKGSAFTLRMEAEYREAAAGVKAVAARDQQGFKLIYWRVE